ncbi:MAG: hypothetical protein M3417_00540 [Actinomycetota bacterium]|nr:hypothetical protein [Actinomycetota bacterium]
MAGLLHEVDQVKVVELGQLEQQTDLRPFDLAGLDLRQVRVADVRAALHLTQGQPKLISTVTKCLGQRH